MSFSADHILDRIRLKRRLRFWQTLGVLALVAVVIVLGARFDVLHQGDRIARLWVEGIIRDDVERDELIKEIAEDENVKAVILRINSPGGTVVGGEALYRSLRALSSKKPVVAVLGEVAASAGYMTAISADHIVAREGTITGSIGVLMQSANLVELMDKIGVKPVLVKSAPLKATPNPMEDMTPQMLKATQGVVMDMYDMFIEMVAERREMEIEQAKQLGDGRIFTGRQAIGAGLIDALGGEEVALSWLETVKGVSAQLDVVDMTYGEEGIFPEAKSALLEVFLGKTLKLKGFGLDGLVSVWQPELK